MAGHEWDDWFEREELIGQISDIRVQNLQVEREVVQKRTFTRWMNLHLEKCNPPLEVRDLFRDIQDGKLLMALLEELSGCKLLHGFKPSSHRIFRLNNIAKVLTFLEERNVKLVSIDAADVADGNPSIVLGLIWNIILFFQIKELTGNIKSQFPSSSSLSSIPTSSDSDTSHSSTPSDERKPTVAPRGHGKAIKTLLQWVQRRTRKYGVAVQDFGKSWASGLAFLAVIKSIDPSLVDMRRALLRSPRENIEEAFRTAHYSLGIPRLLEPEDVTVSRPDEQSIMTYVSQFLEHFPGIEEDDTSNFLERSKIDAQANNYPVRNGVERKRDSLKRDLVQPPPKILVSSVSEDHSPVTSPVLSKVPEDKLWASQESMDLSTGPAQDLNQETSISPQPSSLDSLKEVSSETSRHEEAQKIIESSEKFSTTTDEGMSDLGSPFSPESTPENHMDRDLFIDEGNYSLGSMESLHGKSTHTTEEEEDAYKYILDIKEEESANLQSPNEDIRNESEPDFSENQLSYVERDSGYFQDHKVAIPDPQEVAGESRNESETFLDSLDSSTNHLTDTPDDKPVVFEDGNEPECPVLKYERISISESEEEIKLGVDLAEDPDTSVLNGQGETKEILHNGLEVNDVVSEDVQEPVVVSDQNKTESEEHDDQVCYMCGSPVAKGSDEQADDCNGYSSDTRHFNEPAVGESCEHIPNKLVNKNESISKNLLESESGSDTVKFSHSTNGAQVSDNVAKNNRSAYVNPHDDVDHDDPESEVYVKPIFEGDKNSSHAIGHPERRPAELRLSLSVTPLQPAPPQRSLTESDTDTEDASEGHSERLKRRKAKAGSDLQEQSPFDRHPGEWGAVEPESPAEHCELIKTDMDPNGAKENIETLRDGAVTDASQTLTTIHLRKIVDTSESKGQNGNTIDGSKLDSTINKRSQGKTAGSPRATSDMAWSDIYILFVAWLLIYCIFVLPQMDSRTLHKLLFNIDE